MERNGGNVYLPKNIMLETQNYGYWKARMKQVIRGIHEDAWTAVEEGWTEPQVANEKGVYGPKNKAPWTEDLENMVGLLVKRFDRSARKGEVPQKRNFFYKQTDESDRGASRSASQCDECKGVGHSKIDCPSVKLRGTKCFECKGLGHMQKQCHMRKKTKSLISVEESESSEEESEEEEMNNFAAFIEYKGEEIQEGPEGVTGEVPESDSGSDSEDSASESDSEIDMEKIYKTVCDTLLKTGKEKLILEEENKKLSEEVRRLRQEQLGTSDLAKEVLRHELVEYELRSRIEQLQKELQKEVDEAQNVRFKLNEQTLQIRRLGGSKKLDEIWSHQFRQPTKGHYGLGYSARQDSVGSTKFVPASTKYQERRSVQPKPVMHRQPGCCYYCGKLGHYKAYCNHYRRRVMQLKQQGKYYRSTRPGHILVKRSDLYGTSGSTSAQPKRYERCHMARLTSEDAEGEPWYFDSGCSRHMTGKIELLHETKALKGGTVVFGGGELGNIKAKGNVSGSELPQLKNVCLVEGLNANLISISQLCDQGLEVKFTKVECRAIDEKGSVVMKGIRTSNNCYMWKNQPKCVSVKADLNMWHQKLGHMNVRNLTNLVKNGYVSGVQTLKGEDMVCGPCNKGKQVKVQHKKVQDINTQHVLELVHMDLMGPMQTESIGGKREKPDTIKSFRIWALQLINEQGRVKKIQSDHGGEFQNGAGYESDEERSEDTSKQRAQEEASDKGESKGCRTSESGSELQDLKNHSVSDVIGSLSDGAKTRGAMNNQLELLGQACFVSSIEPVNHKVALEDVVWILAMQEELEQVVRNEVLELVPRPKDAIVDDIIFGSQNQKQVDAFVEDMTQEFEMSMVGELKYFLGLQVAQTDDGIFISQSTYARNLVKRFGLEASKEAKTPMSTTTKLTKDQEGEGVDEKLYRGTIRSLLYLTTSRPDLCLGVGVCARYHTAPKVSHLNAVKRTLKYVKGTINLGVYFGKDTNTNLAGFCDADWAGNVEDRRSTSGGWFFLGNSLVSWLSRKQNSVSLSTAESEYIAMGSCGTQQMWMKEMAAEYGMDSGPLLVRRDNKSAIDISKNPVQHSRTKHIDIRHHFIRELVEEKSMVIEHAATELQLADLFTKPLDFNRFVTLRKAIGVGDH